ncbi:MAG: CheR family methyltransferase [Burkholderiaceae bacterium]
MLSRKTFDAVTELFRDASGIQLSGAKMALVEGRLQKLAQTRGQEDVDAYVRELLRTRNPDELRQVVDRLTTNETYFFREPQHFEHLAQFVAQRPPRSAALRVWSAASSSGEEAYSIAMVLADHLGLEPGAPEWLVLGTDLSHAMVEQARRAVYTMERARHVPQAYLRRFCLKGNDIYTGQLLVSRELRQRVRFMPGNLMQPMTEIGRFDVIFLRNVLIYFDAEGKREIVRRVLGHLAEHGVLYTGHSESITNLGLPLRAHAPAVYGHA